MCHGNQAVTSRNQHNHKGKIDLKKEVRWLKLIHFLIEDIGISFESIAYFFNHSCCQCMGFHVMDRNHRFLQGAT
jgi:hypothetical protein